MKGCVSVICVLVLDAPGPSRGEFLFTVPDIIPKKHAHFIPMSNIASICLYTAGAFKEACARGYEEQVDRALLIHRSIESDPTASPRHVAVVRTLIDQWFMVHVPEEMFL